MPRAPTPQRRVRIFWASPCHFHNDSDSQRMSEEPPVKRHASKIQLLAESGNADPAIITDFNLAIDIYEAGCSRSC